MDYCDSCKQRKYCYLKDYSNASHIKKALDNLNKFDFTSCRWELEFLIAQINSYCSNAPASNCVDSTKGEKHE
jgi:hypothetical protein